MNQARAETLLARSSRLRQVVRHMLEDDSAEYYPTGVHRALGVGYPSAVIQALLVMAREGWIVGRFVRVSDGTRKYYRFTPGSADMLRAALKNV